MTGTCRHHRCDVPTGDADRCLVHDMEFARLQRERRSRRLWTGR